MSTTIPLVRGPISVPSATGGPVQIQGREAVQLRQAIVAAMRGDPSRLTAIAQQKGVDPNQLVQAYLGRTRLPPRAQQALAQRIGQRMAQAQPRGQPDGQDQRQAGPGQGQQGMPDFLKAIFGFLTAPFQMIANAFRGPQGPTQQA